MREVVSLTETRRCKRTSDLPLIDNSLAMNDAIGVCREISFMLRLCGGQSLLGLQALDICTQIFASSASFALALIS
jgi:hypothetical protein